MKVNFKVLTLSFGAILLLNGCASTTDPNSGVKSGAAIGAIGGAILGSTVGGTKGGVLGAVIGGGAGALIGKDRDAQQRKLEAALASEAAANQVAITRVDNQTIKLNIDSEVSFDTNSDKISYGFRNTLNKIVESVREYPATQIDIVGHTDNVGSASYNQDLSERRAVAVAGYFGQNGIAYSRINPVGRGETQPIADNGSSFGRAKNRRVEIFLRTPAQ